MALNRFNPEHARILRRRTLRKIAQPVVFVAVGLGLMALSLAAASSTRYALPRLTGPTETPGWNALHTTAYRAQLETAVHVEVLRGTPDPITIDTLIGDSRYPPRAARWPAFRQQWRVDTTLDPPAVHPPRY